MPEGDCIAADHGSALSGGVDRPLMRRTELGAQAMRYLVHSARRRSARAGPALVLSAGRTITSGKQWIPALFEKAKSKGRQFLSRERLGGLGLNAVKKTFLPDLVIRLFFSCSVLSRTEEHQNEHDIRRSRLPRSCTCQAAHPRRAHPALATWQRCVFLARGTGRAIAPGDQRRGAALPLGRRPEVRGWFAIRGHGGGILHRSDAPGPGCVGLQLQARLHCQQCQEGCVAGSPDRPRQPFCSGGGRSLAKPDMGLPDAPDERDIAQNKPLTTG